MEKKMNSGSSSTKASAPEISCSPSVSFLQAFSVHLISALALAIALLVVADNLCSVNLVSDPSHTLFLTWVVETPIVILVHSWFRLNPEQCSYLKAVGRGALALPVGALVNALGAIVLGAPVGIQGSQSLVGTWKSVIAVRYLPKTINWSLLMSSFTFVPAACVFGSSWSHWQRIFAHSKPIGSLEYMICIPAHGAVIAAWFGAWPMPLDWERPWQEWPICVTYGAMTGYLVGMLVSLCFILARGGRQHLKGD